MLRITGATVAVMLLATSAFFLNNKFNNNPEIEKFINSPQFKGLKDFKGDLKDQGTMMGNLSEMSSQVSRNGFFKNGMLDSKFFQKMQKEEEQWRPLGGYGHYTMAYYHALSGEHRQDPLQRRLLLLL
jgi:hypothetical protein